MWGDAVRDTWECHWSPSTQPAATGHFADQGSCLQSPTAIYFNTQLPEPGSAEVTKCQREDSLNQGSLLQGTEPNQQSTLSSHFQKHLLPRPVTHELLLSLCLHWGAGSSYPKVPPASPHSRSTSHCALLSNAWELNLLFLGGLSSFLLELAFN